MGKDAYIDESLIKSIERIQKIFDIPTFAEASKLYDKMARNSTLGEIIEEGSMAEKPVEKSEFEEVEEKFQRTKEEFLEQKMG